MPNTLLTKTQLRALVALADGKERSMRACGAVSTMESLRARGLIDCRPNESLGDSLAVKINDAGRAYLPTARPITEVDRMLAHGDRIAGKPSARRRTHLRFGKLEIVLVEETAEPTLVYLTNGEDVIVEATAGEMIRAASAVQELLANPPPMKRNPR